MRVLKGGLQAIGFVSTRSKLSSLSLGRSSAQQMPWSCPAPPSSRLKLSEILQSSLIVICRWLSMSPACAISILSVVHSPWILHTRSGPCVHTQQAGLLQRPVCWLSCQSADAVAVCSESSRPSRARAAWPCISLNKHTQLVTLAELSTASHIQVVLAYLLQVFARLGAWVRLQALCANCLCFGSFAALIGWWKPASGAQNADSHIWSSSVLYIWSIRVERSVVWAASFICRWTVSNVHWRPFCTVCRLVISNKIKFICHKFSTQYNNS